MSLLIKIGPTDEPVTVDEVKSELRLDSTFTDDDSMIADKIITAREVAENLTGRSLCSKTYLYTQDAFPYPGNAIRLPVSPVLEVLSITYLDGSYERQTWDAAEYFVASNQSPTLIIPKRPNIYPCPVRVPGCVEITFTAGHSPRGYGDDSLLEIPETLRLGVVKLAKHLYDHPEATSPELQNKVPVAFTDLFRKWQVHVR